MRNKKNSFQNKINNIKTCKTLKKNKEGSKLWGKKWILINRKISKEQENFRNSCIKLKFLMKTEFHILHKVVNKNKLGEINKEKNLFQSNKIMF